MCKTESYLAHALILLLTLSLCLAPTASAEILEVSYLGLGETPGTILVEVSAHIAPECSNSFDCDFSWIGFSADPCPPGIVCGDDYGNDDVFYVNMGSIDPPTYSCQVELLEGVPYTLWGMWVYEVYAAGMEGACDWYNKQCTDVVLYDPVVFEPPVATSTQSWSTIKALYGGD